MIKLFAASFVEFFFFFLALALAMHHIELTRAEPLAFFRSHENACVRKKKKKPTTFLPTCTMILPPTARSTDSKREIHFHSGKSGSEAGEGPG